MERKGIVTIEGNPLTLIGNEIKVGDKAPEFVCLDKDLKEVKLGDYAGKIKVIASVPSLDTPVCDLEIKRFQSEATTLSGEIEVIFVSMDLPFAQKRFCESFDIDKVITLSDHRNADFGEKYGVLIKELRLLSRAIFVLDKNNNVVYVEYVGEITKHPNYDAVIDILKKY